MGKLFEKSFPKPLPKLFIWEGKNIVCADRVHQISLIQVLRKSFASSFPRHSGMLEGNFQVELYQADPFFDFGGFDDCVKQAFVDYAVVDVRVQTVAAAVQDVCEGLHLIHAHFLRDFNGDVLAAGGFVRDLKFVHSRNAVEMVDECAAFSVDFHALIIAAPVVEAGNLESGGDAAGHFGENVREVVDVNLAGAFAGREPAFVHDGAEMGNDRGVLLSGHERNEVETVAAEVAECAGCRDGLHVTPYERAVLFAESPCLIILHADVVDGAEASGEEETAQITCGSFVAVREVDHACHARVLCNLRKFNGFRCVHRDRLFDAVRLAGTCGGSGDFKMDVVRRGDVDRVHVGAGDQVAVIGKAVVFRNAVRFGTFAEALFVNVTESGELEVGGSADAGDVNAAGDASESDRSDSVNSHNFRPFLMFRTGFVALILSYLS